MNPMKRLGPSFDDPPPTKRYRRLAEIQGEIIGTYDCSPVTYAQIYAVLNHRIDNGKSGMPELKRKVQARIAARMIARKERKVAKWIKGMPLYEG